MRDLLRRMDGQKVIRVIPQIWLASFRSSLHHRAWPCRDRQTIGDEDNSELEQKALYWTRMDLQYCRHPRNAKKRVNDKIRFTSPQFFFRLFVVPVLDQRLTTAPSPPDLRNHLHVIRWAVPCKTYDADSHAEKLGCVGVVIHSPP